MSAVKKGQNLLPHSLIQNLLKQETPVPLNLRVTLQQGSAQGPELESDSEDDKNVEASGLLGEATGVSRTSRLTSRIRVLTRPLTLLVHVCVAVDMALLFLFPLVYLDANAKD